MKNYFLLIFLLWGCKVSIAQFSDSTSNCLAFEKIKNFDYNNLKGKKFLKLIDSYDFRRFKKWTPLEKKPFVLSGVLLNYCDSIFLEVHFIRIKHQNSFSKSQEWDFKLLKKEKILKVIVVRSKGQ